MDRLRAPRIYAGGRWWSGHQVAGLAEFWRGAIDDACGGARPTIAALLPASAEGVALFLALASRPATMVLLPPNPSAWPAPRPDFRSMPLVVPPVMRGVADAARCLGMEPVMLPAASGAGAPPDGTDVALLAPDVVLFTSGSSGDAKPVVRTLASKLAGAATRARALGLRAGEGCLIGVPLTSAQGVTMMLTAMWLGGALGLLAPVDHRQALAALALPDFAFWWATPYFADVLGRVALTRPPVAPRLCVTSSPIAREVFERFVLRYGVPLRQVYSSTETGPVSAETAADAAVCHGCAGPPLPGVMVAIGERPDVRVEAGGVGRVWIRSPHLMTGYGIPPRVDALGDVDGWWPTQDLGRLDAGGRLWLEGRLDQSVRTRDGRLVNLGAVEAQVRDLPGVRDVAVVQTMAGGGATFAAVVAFADDGSGGHQLRLADLPDWARPRRVVRVPSLPRLANGKVDRRGCAALVAAAGEP